MTTRCLIRIALATVAACAHHGPTGFEPGSEDEGGTLVPGDDAGDTDGGDLGFGDGGGSRSLDCGHGAKDFVYVITVDGSLYSFAPDKKMFTLIGHAHCSSSGLAQYNSMAVDRSATAWVNVADFSLSGGGQTGVIYRVSTKDASCEASPSVRLPSDWSRVGMGFSVDSKGGSTETLYLASIPGSARFGRLDMGSKTIALIGSVSSGNHPELTGTGDARLYGFFIQAGASYPPSLGEVDKSNATVISPTDMTGLQQPINWAFSFWGGHFYVYTQSSNETSSRVSDFDPVTKKLDPEYMTNIGFSITGAGVSTCAPTTPPQ